MDYRAKVTFIVCECLLTTYVIRFVVCFKEVDCLAEMGIAPPSQLRKELENNSKYNLLVRATDHRHTLSTRTGDHGTDTLGHGKLYGHLHMAKTAGTSLNLLLAARYERVCGHKGYSYDAFQENKRRQTKATGAGSTKKDIIEKVYPGFSRSRVPDQVMKEIGFENCDYVSHEIGWEFWPTFFQQWYRPLELHVPCRDPIEHLMSMCNYKKRKFRCDAPLTREIQSCLLQMSRFSLRLVHDYRNITTRCFRSDAVNEYVLYMESILQKKQLPARYVFKATNRPHIREEECIWRNHSIRHQVQRFLLSSFEYYKYCHECIGSSKDLLAG